GGGGTAVVEEAEVFALETSDELTVLVDHREDEIDFVDLNVNGGDGLFALWACGLTSGRGLSGSLRRSCGRLLSGGGGWSGTGWRRWRGGSGSCARSGLGYFNRRWGGG